jgi:hypothetical protein
MRLNVTLYAYYLFCLVLNPVIYIYIYIYTHTYAVTGVRSWLMSRVRLPVVSLELFIDITLLAALFVW